MKKYILSIVALFLLTLLTSCEAVGYMAAFFRQVKIGVLTLTLEKKQ